MTTFSATDLDSVPVNRVSVFLGDPFLPDRKQLREGMFQDEAGNDIEATDEQWERSYAEELVKAGQLGLKFMDAGWRLDTLTEHGRSCPRTRGARRGRRSSRKSAPWLPPTLQSSPTSPMDA